MANKKTKKQKKAKVKISKSKSKILKSDNKMMKDQKGQSQKSISSKLDDMKSKDSNERRLLKDLDTEFRPLTDFLSKGADKLGEELDKRQSGYKKPKAKGKKKR
jgi:hypothetical protein